MNSNMMIEISFLKVEQGKIVNHHLELVNALDEKGIESTWALISKKFDIPVSEMCVRETYLTQSTVFPTSADLERIWLTFLQHESQSWNVQRLSIRLFVSRISTISSTGASEISITSSQPASEDQVNNTPKVIPLPVASASASAIPALPVTPLDPPTSTNSPKIETKQDQEQHQEEHHEALLSAKSWVKMINLVNATLLKTDKLGKHVHDNVQLIDVFGQGSLALMKLWYLWSQSDSGVANKCIQEIISVSDASTPNGAFDYSSLCPLFTHFPQLQLNPFVNQNLPHLLQIIQLIAFISSGYSKTAFSGSIEQKQSGLAPANKSHLSAPVLSEDHKLQMSADVYMQQVRTEAMNMSMNINHSQELPTEEKTPQIHSAAGLMGVFNNVSIKK